MYPHLSVHAVGATVISSREALPTLALLGDRRQSRWDRREVGSDGEPLSGSSQPAEGDRASSAERTRENVALCTRAHTLMAPEAVLTFRCECEHPLCRDFVVLSLAEYEGATTGSRAVVTPLHGDVDGRSVVKRTSRFCIVEEAQIPL
jgi:hypothetical protein